MDNFYTRHNLAEKVKVLTDGEIRITGTCRLNVINTRNKVGVKKGIDMLKDNLEAHGHLFVHLIHRWMTI
jgi:hypothetical protein